MNFNRDLSNEIVNELITEGAWARFGVDINEGCATDMPAGKEKKEDKAEGKDKAKAKDKMKTFAKKDKEDDEEEMEESVTHACPLCRSELDEALTREDIDLFSEALDETYQVEYENSLNDIIEQISELDGEDLDEFLGELEEDVMEDIQAILDESDEDEE